MSFGGFTGRDGGYDHQEPLQTRAPTNDVTGEEEHREIRSSTDHPTVVTTVLKIFVVIPAHNEQDRLPGCLASVKAAADRVDVPVEVVVVLDACTDGTARAVLGMVRTVPVRAKNVGLARAAGFASFTRPDPAVWFATTDADCLVPPYWLTNQVAHQRRRPRRCSERCRSTGGSIR